MHEAMRRRVAASPFYSILTRIGARRGGSAATFLLTHHVDLMADRDVGKQLLQPLRTSICDSRVTDIDHRNGRQSDETLDNRVVVVSPGKANRRNLPFVVDIDFSTQSDKPSNWIANLQLATVKPK